MSYMKVKEHKVIKALHTCKNKREQNKHTQYYNGMQNEVTKNVECETIATNPPGTMFTGDISGREMMQNPVLSRKIHSARAK